MKEGRKKKQGGLKAVRAFTDVTRSQTSLLNPQE
jgi:hypothetical protein